MSERLAWFLIIATNVFWIGHMYWIRRNLSLKFLWNHFWWKYLVCAEVSVKWPVGKIVVDHNDPRWVDLGGAVWVELDSADPDDHYKPWLEKNVGRQGWDWNWDCFGDDISRNRLTIGFRKSKMKHATVCGLLWA